MKWMLKTPRGMGLEKALLLAEQCGYDGAEIQLYDFPDGKVWRSQFQRTAEKAGERGLLLAVHAPSGDINLSSSNEGIRKESLRQVRETVFLARGAGAAAVTIHPGRLSSVREEKRRQYGWMEEACRELAGLAEELQIPIGFENMEKRPKEVFTSLEMLNSLLEPFRNPFLGVTLDFAHLWTADPGLELSALSLPVVNVHISQCVGGAPHFGLSHPGGELPLFRCFSLLKAGNYEGTVVVEAKDNVTEEGARANLEVLRRTWASFTGN